MREQLQRSDARFIVFDDKLRMQTTDGYSVRWATPKSASELIGRELDSDLDLKLEADNKSVTSPVLFLGVDENGAPLGAVRTKHADSSMKTASLRDVGAMLPRFTATAASHARSLFAFHETHAYCGLCGSRTVADHGGARRRCFRNITGECRGVWYPRVDPAVIALVMHPDGERVLLGRQPRHPPGMYSCLAGHMEHGESVEDAVRREIGEETGVELSEVRFYSSQPWPFPYTLMLGCIAQASTEALIVDKEELEDAKWVGREQLSAMVQAREGAMKALNRRRESASSKAVAAYFAKSDGEVEPEPILFVPPKMAIAGQLIDAYLRRNAICDIARDTPLAETRL